MVTSNVNQEAAIRKPLRRMIADGASIKIVVNHNNETDFYRINNAAKLQYLYTEPHSIEYCLTALEQARKNIMNMEFDYAPLPNAQGIVIKARQWAAWTRTDSAQLEHELNNIGD